MAASLLIEHEQGTYVGTFRGKHQGYYAGNFSVQPAEPNGSRAAMGIVALQRPTQPFVDPTP